VRVSALEDATGLYSLMTDQGDGGLPEALALSQSELKLEGRQSRRLVATVSPEDATRAVFWESSDPSVARVSQSGVVSGVGPGDAVVTAYGAGSIRARCRVEVTEVPVEGIRLLTPEIELSAGDVANIEWEIIPPNATVPDVDFELNPVADIVSVDNSGRLTALREGAARVTIRTLDGDCRVTASIQVNPPPRRCRALLVGEQNYAATVASPRQGSANSVAAVRSMLGELNVDGEPFDIRIALDVSRDGAVRALWDTFGGATAQDLSLVYITCHGYYANGMTCFQMYDGSILTALELRMALDKVPGDVVLLADCCGSGGAIGQASTTADILAGIDAVFSGVPGPSVFEGSRFRVLASASVDQDSYRIGFGERASESAMATVFARAICEGCGWSIEDAGRGELLADRNGDGQVSLDELHRYAARRVTAYLALGDGDYVQTVRVSPEGDARTLFGRT
ncbi:MAG: Ig-like domain-containing protein, partial [bacterium]